MGEIPSQQLPIPTSRREHECEVKLSLESGKSHDHFRQKFQNNSLKRSFLCEERWDVRFVQYNAAIPSYKETNFGGFYRG